MEMEDMAKDKNFLWLPPFPLHLLFMFFSPSYYSFSCWCLQANLSDPSLMVISTWGAWMFVAQAISHLDEK
jgi:hypothetical protein